MPFVKDPDRNKRYEQMFEGQTWVQIPWAERISFEAKYKGQVRAVTKHINDSVVFLVTDDAAKTMIILEHPDRIIDVLRSSRTGGTIKGREWTWSVES